MSGTSCDSIDAGLCEVYPDLSVKLIQGINHPYPEHIRAKIFSAFRGEISIKELCQLNFAVGKCFADAAKILIGEFGKPDLISSHGQTVYHYPFDEKLDNISLKSTLQIGESSILAKETGCMVISNFREKDIAYGGQGAPLVCFTDEKMYYFMRGAYNLNGGGRIYEVDRKTSEYTPIEDERIGENDFQKITFDKAGKLYYFYSKSFSDEHEPLKKNSHVCEINSELELVNERSVNEIFGYEEFNLCDVVFDEDNIMYCMYKINDDFYYYEARR